MAGIDESSRKDEMPKCMRVCTVYAGYMVKSHVTVITGFSGMESYP